MNSFLASPVSKGTDLNMALDYLGKIQRKRAVVFLISDFISENYEQSLKIAQKHYDIIAVSVEDPREKELPRIGLIELEDGETGEHIVVDSNSPYVQKIFRESQEKKRRKREDFFKRIDVDELEVTTDKSYVKSLHQLFRRRSRRINR